MIFINGELPKKPFTEAEKRIITTLVDRKGRLITNDELQDILWQGNYDKYSLWALAKTMQRIREKMRSCGIASEIIQTVRGKGYLIYD
jgi:DNA-binding response OmpR family regulator